MLKAVLIIGIPLLIIFSCLIGYLLVQRYERSRQISTKCNNSQKLDEAMKNASIAILQLGKTFESISKTLNEVECIQKAKIDKSKDNENS